MQFHTDPSQTLESLTLKIHILSFLLVAISNLSIAPDLNN